MGILDALRGLNLGIGIRTCPECGGVLERDYVRAPHLQDHWRGVPADVCTECDYYEYAESVYNPS